MAIMDANDLRHIMLHVDQAGPGLFNDKQRVQTVVQTLLQREVQASNATRLTMASNATGSSLLDTVEQ